MGTFIREELAVTNKDESIEFIVFRNVSVGMTIQQEDPMDAPYFTGTFTKEDWNEIKRFIDEQFNP